MRHIFTPLFCALLLGATGSLQAAPLTLEEAQRLAESHNPMLRAAASQAAGARAALDTASAFPNPEVEYGSGNSHLLPPGTPPGRNQLFGVSQPLEWPGVRAARRHAAEAGIEAGDALLTDARLSLRALVRQNFLEVQRREEESQLAEQGRALLEQIRNRVKLRVEVGEAARYELVKSEAEVLAAENFALGAEVRTRQARDRLRATLGAELPAEFEITPTTPMPGVLPPLDALQQELLARQPQLQVAHAETRRAEARLEHERNLRLPQPTLKWSAERHPDVNLWRIGLTFPLPLWDRRSGPVGEAQAGLERARAEEDRLRLTLLSDLDQAHGRFLIAQRQLHTFENGLMRDAEAALKVAQAAYRHGERGILDYLDAQRVFRTTRMDYLNARFELQAALIEIDRLRAAPLYGDAP